MYLMTATFFTGSPFDVRKPFCCQFGSHSLKPGEDQTGEIGRRRDVLLIEYVESVLMSKGRFDIGVDSRTRAIA